MRPEVTTPLHMLAAMETARAEVADRAMEYWSTLKHPGDHHLQLHDKLLHACETYAAAREVLIDGRSYA